MREIASTVVIGAFAALAALGFGCDDGDGGGDAPVDAGGDGGDAGGDTDTGSDACEETADGSFPAGPDEMAWEEGGGDATVLDFGWNPITGNEGEYTIGEEPMWEAVRFDLPAPATVHGARVQWGNLPAEEEAVTLGAYDDFGHNGFDFFRWESLWEGTRCLSGEDEGAWVDYVFDSPIEVDEPGLFWIAHYWEGPEAPALRFDSVDDNCDEQGENCCQAFSDCHSSINMPEADANTYYNGLSLQFPYDFAVRLVVELHDTILPEDKWFQVDDALVAGRRVAWGDYDGDGDDDLMTNGPTLYRNEGDGSFADATEEAGLTAAIASSNGGVWGDFDNDGCLDYFGTGGNSSPDILLRNRCDGTFEDVTIESFVNDLQDYLDCVEGVDEEYSPTEGAAWVDLDEDGLLDLYLAEYECGGLYENYEDRVWHNEGDGTFSEWTDGHGFSPVRHAGRGVSPIDYDMDGVMEVLVSNYRLDPNFLYIRAQSGSYDDWADLVGVAGRLQQGAYGHTIGSAWLDLEGDGDWDLVEANLAHPRYYHFSDKTMVLVNDGSGVFEDTAASAGILYRETHSNPTVQDFDNDGDTDLFVTCVYDGRPSDMYLNLGDGTFDLVSYESGAVVENGWGSAASDWDRDGDVDLVADVLLRNDTAAEGNHWLQVRALGGQGSLGPVNAAGIGSVVRVEVDGEVRLGHTSGGSGTGCQDSLFVSFGLGDATEADGVEVLYPGGSSVEVEGPIAADQRVWIGADGSVGYGWSPPE